VDGERTWCIRRDQWRIKGKRVERGCIADQPQRCEWCFAHSRAPDMERGARCLSGRHRRCTEENRILLVYVWMFSSLELLILFGVALMVLFLIGKKMKRESNPELKLVRLFQGLIALFLVICLWSARGPSESQLLERHLGITNTSIFHDIQTDYDSAREWTAWIYLESSRENIERLLQQQDFKTNHDQALGLVSFKKAPAPPARSDARTFWKKGRGTMDFAVTTPGSTQLWFVAIRY
jgi:hypothetical protein